MGESDVKSLVDDLRQQQKDLADKVDVLRLDRARSEGAAKILAILASVLSALAGGIGTWVLAKLSSVYTTIEDARSGPSLPPVGSILAWPTEFKVPDGWRICDGSNEPFNDKLWDALRGIYSNPGQGKPAQILLPNLKGCFLRGAGAIDPAHASNPIGTKQDDAVQQHTHNLTDKPQGRGDGSPPRNTVGFGQESDHESGFVERARTADETRPVNYAVHWIIRVK